jgi:transcription elongation factor Elf1
MQNKKILLSLSLSMVVLFSMLFQSVHTYEHFKQQFAQEKCHHSKIAARATQITHRHIALEDCKICQLSIGNYIPTTLIGYSLYSNFQIHHYFSDHWTNISSFSGSLYSYRGPPSSIA